MEGRKNKMTMLMAMRNHLNEENQRLNSNLKRMISKYNDLRKQIRFLEQQRRGVDGSQVFNPDHRGNDLVCTKNFSGAVSHKSDDQYRDYHERGEEENQNKVPKFMGDQQLHSKKRKIENGFASSMDDSPCCDEKLLKKKQQALSRGSDEQTAAAPKRFISVQRTSEASWMSDGCQWRKYGQKMTRNNTCPRSYYKCAMVPGCPVKKQVQRCAENPTIVITTYKGEHIHCLSPLAIAVIRASTNQPTAWSSFPTITVDLTDNRPNPEFHLQPAHLAAGSFLHWTPLSDDTGQEMDNKNEVGQSSITDSVASIKADPHFTAALAVAVAGFMLKSGAPIEGMPNHPSATPSADGSTNWG